jgi:hypothetical protein
VDNPGAQMGHSTLADFARAIPKVLSWDLGISGKNPNQVTSSRRTNRPGHRDGRGHLSPSREVVRPPRECARQPREDRVLILKEPGDADVASDTFDVAADTRIAAIK